jgi:hypothetical protein
MMGFEFKTFNAEPHDRQNVLYSRRSSVAQAGYRLSQP